MMIKKTKLLLIDNFDSFTFNLQHLFSMEDHVDLVVRRNNDDFLGDVEKGVFDGIIIGPGPGSPEDSKYFGNCQWILENFEKHATPVLGICLGFQGIFSAFGGRLKVSNAPMHGKTSALHIIEAGSILEGIKENSKVMRYHSILADVDIKSTREILFLAEANASKSTEINGREVMAIRHKTLPIFGLQFHPESFATEAGSQYANNFVNIVNAYQEEVAKNSL